jgi:hypothetical protein
MEKEREHTKFIIQRFDTYIAGANTKGNFLLAFNIFLCGGVISNYKNLTCLMRNEMTLLFLNLGLLLLFIISLITTALIIKAVYPFLNSGNSSKDKYHSHVFFQSISEYESDKSFAEAYQRQEDKEVNEDLARQAYILAKGLSSKYECLAWVMRFVYSELILLLVILIIITLR